MRGRRCTPPPRIPPDRFASARRGAFSTKAAARYGSPPAPRASMPSTSSCAHRPDMARRRGTVNRRGGCIGMMTAVLLAIAVVRANAQSTDPQPDHVPTSRPDLVIHAFGSVDYQAMERAASPNSFALGQVALFVTGGINDRVSVLAEVVLEASGSNTEVTTDLERLQLTYRADDHLNISAGRYHTGIGYYNAAFHHGSYFEIPVGRPRVFRFEDTCGPMQIHEVDVSVRGQVPKTDSQLRYVAEVGNGRRWTDLENLEGLDQNKAKSTNFGLSLRPDDLPGVEIGGSFYRDDVPATPEISVANHITAAYAIYRTPTMELMGEWLRLSYHQTGDARYNNHGGYVQASQAFGKIRPYYRYDRLDINRDTPLIGGFGSSIEHILGVRLDPAPWVGLKAQYQRLYENDAAGANGVHVQLVFVF